ncbi:MAG: peptide deformylase [Zetaproteobacteria bacterium]|nr:MAG: peptide deformylase [Zetaproteobacteria bacterium]
MAVRPILIYPHPALRKVSAPIADPTAPDVRRLADDLAETMYDAPGVGLAAPQIGVHRRIVVTDIAWREEGAERDLHVWINPEILWRSSEERPFEEGCLSIPDTFVEVLRPAAVAVRWQDLQGATHEAEYDGMMATALQHEFDHLDGRLFIDLIKPVKQKLLKRRLKKRAQREGRH